MAWHDLSCQCSKSCRFSLTASRLLTIHPVKLQSLCVLAILKMSLLRSQRSLSLWRACATCQRTVTTQWPRHISQSASLRLGEPDPNAIPSDAMQSTEDQASMITVEESSAALPSTYKPQHQPDWNVIPDQATSYARASLCLAVICD